MAFGIRETFFSKNSELLFLRCIQWTLLFIWQQRWCSLWINWNKYCRHAFIQNVWAMSARLDSYFTTYAFYPAGIYFSRICDEINDIPWKLADSRTNTWRLALNAETFTEHSNAITKHSVIKCWEKEKNYL